MTFGQVALDFLSINLPPLCNYNCSFCFAADSLNLPSGENKREMLPIAALLDIVRQAHQYGLRHIEISGEGEPTLPIFRPYIQAIVETADALGIHVTLITNGSLLDQPLLQFLSQHNTSITISIKYFHHEKYNRNVGRRMFEVVRKNIDLVQEVFAQRKRVDGCRVYNFGLFSAVFDDNQEDNEMLRAHCDEHDIFFSLSTQIPHGNLADTQVDFVQQDAIVEQYQHSSIILVSSSIADIGFAVCGTFYYGIGINAYGDWLFDAHAGVAIGNISDMSMQQAIARQQALVGTLFAEYHCQSYCPLRDINYQAFLEEHLLPNI
ncbi:MAG: radical SAM protein [bacterium]